jgi:hypothetical protein
LKTKGFSPELNPTQDLFVSGSKSEIPIENQHCVGCVGLEGGFSSGEKTDRPGDAPEARSEDISTDRTCVQCKGEIDGTERLVAVSGRAVWLHAVCERFWLGALEGER